MPTIYVDRGFLDVVRDEQERLEREEAKRQDVPKSQVHVPERQALEELLAEGALERIESEREEHE